MNMVELKLYVSDVDFDSVIRLFGNGMMGGVASMAARAMSENAKEELAVRYLNGSARKLEEMLENAASAKGVRLKISGARASVVRKTDQVDS